MNEAIYFFATVPIFIAGIYALYHVVTEHEKKHHVQHMVVIALSAATAWIISTLLKEQIAHPRPEVINTLFTPNDPYSFPSGHTTFMFALAFAMYSFDKRAGMIIGALALITGISRVLAGVHFWYDILGGFVLGAGVASIVVIIAKRLINK